MEKEWGPESQDEDVWEDLDEAGDPEPLNSNRSSSPPPVKQSLHPHLRISAPQRQRFCQTLLTPLRTLPHGPSPHFDSRPITGLKSQQPPKVRYYG